jgi:hypothetical protein
MGGSEMPDDSAADQSRFNRRQVSLAGVLVVLGALVVVVIAAFLVLDVIRDDEIPETAAVTSLDDVAADPARFAGEQVSVSGEVRETLASHVFTLGTDSFPVVTATPIEEIAGSEAEMRASAVQVEGTVQQFQFDVVEDELGVSLDRSALAGLEGRYVIVASAVIMDPLGDAGRLIPDARDPGVLSVGDILGDPDRYLEEEVTVVGEIVTSAGERAFVLSGLAYQFDDLLVLTGEAFPQAFPVSIPVRVVGTLREFDRQELDEEYLFDLDEGLVTHYEGQPVIVATETTFFPRFDGVGEDPTLFVGARVTVRAVVEEVISPRIFAIGEGLVLVFAPEGANIEEGTTMIISGEMRRIDENLHREMRIEPGAVDDLESRVVLVADDIAVVR